MTLPTGICIPPSIKTIMGITMAPFGLLVCHSPKWQCSISTLVGMLYLALKAYLFSGVSTKLRNLPISLRKVMKERKEKERTLRAA